MANESDSYNDTGSEVTFKNSYYGEYKGRKASDVISIDKEATINFASIDMNKGFDPYSFATGIIVIIL